MKIGILTFHNIPNIGAILQSYSLCQALRQLGFECEIIDYNCENIIRRELTYHHHPNIFKDIAIRCFVWPKTVRKIKRCRDFMLSKEMYSVRQYNRQTIADANNHYDILMSGSDMIWDFAVTENDTTYLLDFSADNKYRYSYGSSCGDSVWNKEQLSVVRQLLNRYNRIAVREESMRDILCDLGINAQLVADPTMLLTPDQWGKMAVNPKQDNYVVVYFPSEKNLRAASLYAKKNNLQVIVINWGLPYRGFINCAPNDPMEWVGYLKNAKAVFTNSYHGLLFALYFNKPVWIGKKGNRFSSILDYLGIKGVELDEDIDFQYTIDYNRVDALLDKMRESSLKYLKGIGR